MTKERPVGQAVGGGAFGFGDVASVAKPRSQQLQEFVPYPGPYPLCFARPTMS